jgi:hypothetical protein
MRSAQDSLVAAHRQQLRSIDAQPGWQREQQLGVMLKVFDTDDHIHSCSADLGVILGEVEPFVSPPRFHLQLVPGLLELQLVMSNQRFFKIVCFRFPTNVPKKIEYIRF